MDTGQVYTTPRRQRLCCSYRLGHFCSAMPRNRSPMRDTGARAALLGRRTLHVVETIAARNHAPVLSTIRACDTGADVAFRTRRVPQFLTTGNMNHEQRYSSLPKFLPFLSSESRFFGLFSSKSETLNESTFQHAFRVAKQTRAMGLTRCID